MKIKTYTLKNNKHSEVLNFQMDALWKNLNGPRVTISTTSYLGKAGTSLCDATSPGISCQLDANWLWHSSPHITHTHCHGEECERPSDCPQS